MMIQDWTSDFINTCLPKDFYVGIAPPYIHLSKYLEGIKCLGNQNNLDNTTLTDDELLDFIIRFPKILQRPIIKHRHKVVIARPPENILNII